MCVKSWSEVQREKRERKSSKPKVKKVAKASFRRKNRPSKAKASKPCPVGPPGSHKAGNTTNIPHVIGHRLYIQKSFR